VKTSQNHLPSLLSAILFILGALFLFGIGLLMAVTAFASFGTGIPVKAGQAIFFAGFSFAGVILFLAAFFAFQKYLQKPSADQNISIPIPNRSIVTFIILTCASILIGYQIGGIKAIAWLLLPILTIPAIVLPLGVLLAFGTRKLPFGTRWQTWSVLGLGMSLTPLILFAAELFIGLMILLGVVAYVIAQPELASQLQTLSQQIMILGPESKATLDLLSPFLTKPAVIVTALIYIAVLVPAVEEIFKPLGVWFFARKLESQAQGFALGALSGAAYALIETIGVSGQTADWASLLSTRIGTGLLHITTSALMGAAIVAAWRERRYLRFVGTYLLAILLHGLWNSLAILFTFSSLAQTLDQGGFLSTVQPELLIAMIILAAVLFAILVLSNRGMRGTIRPSPATNPGESIDTNKTT
jgi:protease prsW family protein